MSDIRALLLTDVVDSTKLSQQIGDAAMAEVWIAHDRAARDLLPVWRGREIDKTDGMLMMFDSAADAVNYALAYHRALAALPTPLKARAGLHVGAVILRENSAEDVARGAKPLEVEGLAKPTAARVMSVAAGGQTLLTPRFAAPPDSDKVYRVVRVDDWWMPVREIPNNLPLQPSSFIGRERELDEVKAALATARLVTLLGMGGLGKTRLSLQVAAEVMHLFTDGVWFIDLSPIRDAELVASEAAHVLGVAEEPGRPLLQTLCAHLKTRRVLLVLDNCEHLIKASADLAHAVVRAAPNVRIISSSREPLHIPGEKTYPILPLPVPGRGDSVEALARSTAVRLFVDRAQAHKPSFALTEREAPAVAELVARLEGIPLALELAAARVRSMSVLDINARLKHRYKLLTGGGRVLQERQQTLRALVDWSYDLLADSEKCVLERLGVFVGGFDLAAAEAVGGADPVDSFEVLDLLGSLVEKSLVMVEEHDQGSRYRMLETIREYAREKLEERGDDAAATAARHCEHYFAFAKEARDGGHRAGALGRGRPVHRGEAGGGAERLLDAVRPRHRGPRGRSRGAAAARGAGGRHGAGVGAVRRRDAGHQPERPRGGARDAGALPRTAPPARQGGRHRGHPVDAGDGAAAGRRRRRRRRQRTGGPADLQEARRPGGRGDRVAAPRPVQPVARRGCGGARASAAEPEDRPGDRPPGNRGRVRTAAGSRRLRGRRCRCRRVALRALAGDLSRGRRQARRGEGRLVVRAGGAPLRGRGNGKAAPGRGAARVSDLRDARGTAGLPGGSRRPAAGRGQGAGGAARGRHDVGDP
ncbi:MAG: NB-ARC domain-containing protein [Burkholderiaceae bacterium]|nr:NB-ARC domain-containing protein [Burkholderiaceae bacterium]